MTKEYLLFFIRHGKLLLPYKDHAEMPLDVLADLASSKLNPPIDVKFAEAKVPELSNVIPFKDISKIYASPSRRCQDTAQFISKFILENHGNEVEIVTAQALREVTFDLFKILPEGDRQNFDIASLNDTVFEAMTSNNAHCEYVASAYRRIHNFMESHVTEQPSLFITHDFIMRVIESYIKHKGDPSHKISYEELKTTQRNLYLSGFATNATLQSFSSLRGMQ